MERKVRKCIPLLAKAPDLSIPHGQFNGYIAIPYELWYRMSNAVKYDSPNHEFDMRMEYEHVPNEIYRPHGGLTFGKRYDDFNADIHMDFIPMLDVRKVDTRNYFVIGFDTCHWNDTAEMWTAKTVREEVFTLYKSIQDYIKVRY